ncbi:hypothetical protein V8E36_004433 [Tilletia maclaganii]
MIKALSKNSTIALAFNVNHWDFVKDVNVRRRIIVTPQWVQLKRKERKDGARTTWIAALPLGWPLREERRSTRLMAVDTPVAVIYVGSNRYRLVIELAAAIEDSAVDMGTALGIPSVALTLNDRPLLLIFAPHPSAARVATERRSEKQAKEALLALHGVARALSRLQHGVWPKLPPAFTTRQAVWHVLAGTMELHFVLAQLRKTVRHRALPPLEAARERRALGQQWNAEQKPCLGQGLASCISISDTARN